jgi:negative regulator of sigma E activity
MTTQKTPTTKPTNSSTKPESRGTWPVTPRARDEQRPPRPRPASSWMVSVGIAAALAMAIWLVTAGVTNDDETTPGARADQTPTAPQQELADRELQRFYNRAEADRRQVENLQNEQQLPDPSADREFQRFYNRAEADRRQVENLQNEQQLPDPSADPSRS